MKTKPKTLPFTVLTFSLALLILVLAFIPSSESSSSYALINPSTRFKLNAYNTYVYTANAFYASQIKVYSDQLVFTSLYQDVNHVLDTLTLKVENGNLTVNTWFDGVKFEATVSAPSGTTSTTVLKFPTSLGKPSICKINGEEIDEGYGWTWNPDTYELTFTVYHQSDATISALWTTTPTGGGGGGPAPQPSPLPQPPAPPPPEIMPPAPTVNLVVVGVLIIVGIVVFAVASSEAKPKISVSRRKWSAIRRRAFKKKVKWKKPKTKPVKWRREKTWE